MIRFCSLSSGSKGNTSFIEINDEKYLIDIGNTNLYVEKKLREININPKEIRGIFISHYHHDHVEGLKTFIKKYDPIVFLTKETFREVSKTTTLNKYIFLKDTVFEKFKLVILPTSHDAIGSCGFIFDDNLGNNVVYITDTGYISEKNLKLMTNKKLYFFESNHDITMLMNGQYPYYLKQRILGDKGHLSNKSSAYYLHEMIGSNTNTIILAHLSEENNRPEIALSELENILNKYNQNVDQILIGKQNERSELIEVC